MHEARIQTLLGFDHGLKRIGVAVGQCITASARPLSTLAAMHGKPNWQQVQDLLTKWQPDALVVGMPLTLTGEDQDMSLHAKRFVNRLHGRFHIKVFLKDERFTTLEAKQKLFESGGFQALQKAQIDSFAAQIILESWMNAYLQTKPL